MLSKLFGKKGPKVDRLRLTSALLAAITYQRGGTLRVSMSDLGEMPVLNVRVSVDAAKREYVVTSEPVDTLFSNVLRSRKAGGS